MSTAGTAGARSTCRWMDVRYRYPHIILLLITAFICIGSRLSAQVGTPAALVKQYLLALQRHDYLTAAKLTSEFKLGEWQIQEQNPRSLWPKLLSEFWNEKASLLIGYDLNGLLTPDSKWVVSEVRNHGRIPAYPSLTYFEVFVALSYPSREHAPTVKSRILRKAIISFGLRGSLLLNSVEYQGRIENGDVPWPEIPKDHETLEREATERENQERKDAAERALKEEEQQRWERRMLTAVRPIVLSQSPPVYPPLAKQAKIQGMVRFKAIIGKDGANHGFDADQRPSTPCTGGY